MHDRAGADEGNMSANSVKILPFPAILHPADRVQAFIALVRDEIDALVSNEEWPNDAWHVGGHFITKGQNRDNRMLPFYKNSATISARQEIRGEILDPAFREFAKAYMRYTHSTSPVSFENTRKRLKALQLIEAAFHELGVHPAIENINVVVLNTAVEMAKAGVGPAQHYQFALSIQQVYTFCLERNLMNGPFQWKHGVRKPKDRTEEIGKAAKEWRENRLPSPEAFHALAHIFRNAETFIDRLYSSICAICISIPIRAHEVLQLRLDCEVHERVKCPETGDDVEAYGIRVWPGKGSPPQVKWVPTQMVSVVQEAVRRLREMCSDARSVAKWYESFPGSLWLPPELEIRRQSDFVSLKDLQRLLAMAGLRDLTNWLRTQGIPWLLTQGRKRRSDDGHVRITAVASAVVRLLPSEFPYLNGAKDQLYSETLAILLVNQGHSRKANFNCAIEKPTVQAFERWLSGHDGGKKPSVFKAWGFSERDGSEIKITTHTFRHWLNTVAQLKGMSELDIAKWSGRDAAQNKSYNHVTSEEILSQIREALDNGRAVGPMFEAAKVQGVNRPVDRREFIDAQIGSALTTDFGICVHDYSLLPCQSHGDCLGCAENVFVKSDGMHRDKVLKRLLLAEKQLNDALAALDARTYGADRWLEAHQLSIARMRRMLAIHDDPGIADGTIVNLPDGAHDNEIAMAVRDRVERSKGDGEILLPLEEAGLLTPPSILEK